MLEQIHLIDSSSIDGSGEGIHRRRQPITFRDFVKRVVATRLAEAPSTNFMIADVRSFQS
jgi:hypothetical protein